MVTRGSLGRIEKNEGRMHSTIFAGDSNVGDSVSAEPFGGVKLFDKATIIENEPLTWSDDRDTGTEIAINE